MFVPWMIVSLLMTAAFLKMLENVLPDLEIDGWLPAFLVAAVLPLVGIAVAFATGPLRPLLAGGPWVTWAFGMAVSTIALAMAFAAIPGIKASAVSTIVASIALAVFNTAIDFALDAAFRLAATGAS